MVWLALVLISACRQRSHDIVFERVRSVKPSVLAKFQVRSLGSASQVLFVALVSILGNFICPLFGLSGSSLQ